jgi:carboxypeptidase T
VKKIFPTLTLLVLAAVAMPTPAVAAEPSGFGYYHTYAEVKQLIDNTVAAHPGIARRFNIGKTYQGRKMWGIKISDNVGVDEAEPEVFINAQIHARERASGELALATIGWLTDNYGAGDALGQRVTDVVNSREIFIVPVMNPDGAEFDIKGGVWHQWRKNRQPIPDSTAIGVDLNRQFGYMWGGGGNASDKPSSDFYRGPNAWYAPEVRNYRDFVNGRYQNGKQQIKVILSLHSAGRLVLWPYSYTKADVPPEMTQDDHDAFVALGTKLASLNGYKPEQGSDLYRVPGDQDDWAYHEWGIFTMTFELKAGSNRRYYPTQSELTADVGNNRSAVLYLLEQADCAYREAGLAAGHC